MFKKQQEQRPRRRTAERLATPGVFSYHSSAVSREKEKKQQSDAGRPSVSHHKLRRALKITLFLALAAAFIANMLLSNTPKVVMVGNDTPTFLRDEAEYKETATQALKSSVLNNNKLTIDTGRVRTKLLERFPELADASVSLPIIGKQPTVYIQPSAARLLLSVPGGATYVLDGSGKAIATGEHAVELREAGLPEARDESGLPITPGSTVLPGNSIAFITEVIGQLKAKELTPEAMILPAGNSELHIRLPGKPYTIKFNLRGSAREEAGAFLAAKHYIESQNKAVGEYIDVRVDNRVYYK